MKLKICLLAIVLIFVSGSLGFADERMDNFALLGATPAFNDKIPFTDVSVNTSKNVIYQNLINVYNVEMYGAVGDGTTDDTVAIQDTIDACPLGGTVYLPAKGSATGGYLVSNLTIKHPMTFCGDGRGSILKAKTGSTGYILNVDGEASGASVNEHGAAHGQLYGVTVRDLHLDGNSRGPDMGGIKQQTAEHCLYQNLWIEDFKREAIDFYRSNRETYVSNTFIRWCGNKTAERTGYPAINLDDAGSGNDTNNGICFNNVTVVYTFGDGVWMDTANGEALNVRHIVFINCFFHGITTFVDGAGNNPFDSTFTSDQTKYHMFDIGTAEEITIASSMFPVTSGYETAGIIIQTGSNGDPLNILISDCNIVGRYSAGGDTSKDIVIHLKNGVLTLDDTHIDGSADAGASNLTVDAGSVLRFGITNSLSGLGPTISTGTVVNALSAKIGVPIDLSGAATSQMVLLGLPKDAYLHKAVFIYTEASSADAGCGLKVGKASDDDYYYTGTSLINKSQWDAQGITLLKHDIAPVDIVTVTSAGGKAGAGEVILNIEYLIFDQ